ncbi:Uncharacterised protein [uncultured archaeon]|nr:Uncharacterised protein [uncultured archaeon]
MPHDRILIKAKDRARRVWGIKTTPKVKGSKKAYNRKAVKALDKRGLSW